MPHFAGKAEEVEDRLLRPAPFRDTVSPSLEASRHSINGSPEHLPLIQPKDEDE